MARIIQATAERALTARGTVVPTAGTCESFNPKRRNEPLDGRIFHSLAEAKVVVEGWRCHQNTKRLHSSPGHRPPAPEVVTWPASPATPAVAIKPAMP